MKMVTTSMMMMLKVIGRTPAKALLFQENYNHLSGYMKYDWEKSLGGRGG